MLLPKRGTSQSSENTSDRIVTGFLTGNFFVIVSFSIIFTHIYIIRNGWATNEKSKKERTY